MYCLLHSISDMLPFIISSNTQILLYLISFLLMIEVNMLLEAKVIYR